MSKLLNANFSRLWKSKAFWITAAVLLVWSVVAVFNDTRIEEGAQLYGYGPEGLEYYFFEFVPHLGVIYGIFTALFIGTEHSDGTIRNKLIVGHTRWAIYLANFLTCFVAGLIFDAVWYIGFAPGYWLIAPFSFGWDVFAAYTLVVLGMTASFTAIYTWISMMSSNKALTVVFVIVLWVAMILVGSGLYDVLDAPETIGGMAYVNGEFVMIDEEPNPRYLTGAKRTVLEIIQDTLPSAQGILLTCNEVERPYREAGMSVLLTICVTGAGILTFKRKNLK